MSWLNEMANKAELFLNKIDENAAAVLKKEPKVRRAQTDGSSKTNIPERESVYNGSCRSRNQSGRSTSSTSKSPVIKYPDIIDSVTHDNSMANDFSYERKVRTDSNVTEDMREILRENELLKNEVRSLNSEISLLLNRLKESEEGSSSLMGEISKIGSESSILKKEHQEILRKLKNLEKENHNLLMEAERLKNLNTPNDCQKLSEMEKDLVQFQKEAQKREYYLNKEIDDLKEMLNEKVYINEFSTSRMGKEDGSLEDVGECEKSVCKCNTEMGEVYSDLSRSIDEPHDDIPKEQYLALKQDFERVKKEKVEQEKLSEERISILEKKLCSAQLEVSKKSATLPEASRVSSLTCALVRKQAALEQASAQAAQLRVELEKEKNKWREAGIDGGRELNISLNDTDDVKARSPWRYAGRIYAALDNGIVRTVASLQRRIPYARIVLLFYLVLLHSVVCLVLYSWVPEK